MHFAWMPVPGSKSYRLNVYSGDTSLVYRQITSELSADAKKSLYGRFVGNGITVHQYATLYVVHFDPQTKMTIAFFNTEEK